MSRRSHIDLSQRVSPRDLPELMDGDCTYEEFRDCLRSLRRVNRWFLGYRPTLAWLERLPWDRWKPIHILDVGSGGGDLLQEIALWSKKRAIPVKLTGIDLNPYASRAAMELVPANLNISWVTGDAMQYCPEIKVDVIVTSLMTHHLENEQIVTLLQWMERTAQQGWFINDLERSMWSYRLFGMGPWHPIVRHDGPVSFRRAFRAEDWNRLLEAARLPRNEVTIDKWRPGRLCVGRWKG